MPGKIENILSSIMQPKGIVFCVAVFNYIWFFSHSRIVQEFGSNTISFCAACAWYWEWSLTNLPSLSLFAAVLMLLARWQAYLAACIIGGYQSIEGINWLRNASGYLSGFQDRVKIISERILNNHSDVDSFWTFLDFQYLLTVLIFATALIYLVKSLFDKTQTSVNNFE